MAPKQQSAYRSNSSKTTITGSEKMRLSHLRVRKHLQRLRSETAHRVESGKPVHAVKGVYR